MEIMEVFEDVKDKVGDKWFYLLLAGLGLIFVYNLSKGSGGDSPDTLIQVDSTASYPDAVTNADVIIATLQDSIEYSEQEIISHFDDNFEATNDYINKGLESQQKLMEENFDSIMGSLDELADAEKNTQALVNQNGSTIIKHIDDKTEEITTGTSKTDKVTTYYKYKTKEGLNTSTSIVDALKAIGINSSFANRTRIANANGIKNYGGTKAQNTKLLSLLKQGKLKMVSR